MKILAFRSGRRADLAGGDFLALLLDDVDHVLRRQTPRLKQVRVEPYTHRVLPGAEHRNVPHSIEATKLVLDVDHGVVRQKQAVEAAVGRAQIDEFEDRGRFLFRRHALELHFLRQRRQGDGHAVLHEDLRQIGIRADGEGDDQSIGAVVGVRRLHVEHVLDAVDLLLDRQGDGIDDGAGAGARVARRDLHGRRHDVGILRARQLKERDEPDEHDDQRKDVGQHRPFDEEARDRACAAFRVHFEAGSGAPAFCGLAGSGSAEASCPRCGSTFAPGKAR